MKTKVLFVCYGNICRSPMAKYMFLNMIDNLGLNDKFIVDSAGTSNEEEGNPMYPNTIKKLNEMHIPYDSHTAKQITYKDYNEYDYIIVMDEMNKRDLISMFNRSDKVYKLLDFTPLKRDIEDPWGTRNFDVCYEDIDYGLKCFLDYLDNK